MTDPRYIKLANLLVSYSTEIKKGEHVMLDMIDTPDEMTIEMMRAVRRRGGIPIVDIRRSRVTRENVRDTNEATATLQRELELFRMKKMHAYIAIRGADNASETSDVPSDLMALHSKIIRPVLDQRVNKTKWCVLRWPTPSMAQGANMSTEAFENFYFDVCTMNYPKMAKAMLPLQKRFNRADKVHLTSPGTDLRFSIKGIGALLAEGKRNIPDGEVISCKCKN
jgi:aminopeptidase